MSKLIFVSLLTLMLLQCQQKQQTMAFKIVNVNVQKSFVPVAYTPVTATSTYSYSPPKTYSYVPPTTPPGTATAVVSKTDLIRGVSDTITAKINLLSSILQSALQIKTQITQGLLRSYQNSITSGPQNGITYSKTVTIG